MRVQRNKWVIASDPGRVGSGADWNTGIKHAPDRRRVSGAFLAVTIDVGLALVRHTVLYCDTATQCLDPVNAFCGDGFGVIEEPVNVTERDFPIDLLKNIQCSFNSLVVRRM